MLFLFDFARPGLNLVDDFALYVIPVESVRSVLSRKAILRKVVYRPSSLGRMQVALAALSASERDLVRALAARTITPEQLEVRGPTRRARILELAEAFVTHQLNSGDLGRDVAAPLALSLLRARSILDVQTGDVVVPPPDIRPERGHGSARLAGGIGVRDGEFFQVLRARPAYHDLLDPAGGYAIGASIEFFDAEFRHYQGEDALIPDRFTGLAINSLTPRDALVEPLS